MTALDPWAPADPLGDALHFLRMSGAFYCRSELTEPWGMTLPPMPGYAWFHVATSGRAWLEAAGAPPAPLSPGGLTLVPHGDGHALRSEPGAPAPGILDLERERVSERYEVLRHGGGGERAVLVCGAVRFGHPAARGLVSLLPRVLRVDAAGADAQWMHGALGLMAAEAARLRPGGEAVITRLGDILVIQAIRSWIEGDPAARTGWLGALHDPQIGRALALMHREPARPWTLGALAREAAMSRSAFAARFRDLVGEPAMAHLARWRMGIALDALANERATVAEAAARVGYRSEAAFARAFQRVVGIPPGAARREAGAPA